MPIRDQLVDEALIVLEEDGLAALNARMLSRRIGASTMVVYTHFNGMAGLYEALAREAFRQFGDHLGTVDHTDDPVADLFSAGLAYRDYAISYPERYRFMFGMSAPSRILPLARDLTAAGTPGDSPEVESGFAVLLEHVERCMAAEAIARADPLIVAAQIWTAAHGYVLLEILGVFGEGDRGVVNVLAPHVTNLLVGLGADLEAIQRSSAAVTPPAPIRSKERAPKPASPVKPGRRPRR